MAAHQIGEEEKQGGAEYREYESIIHNNQSENNEIKCGNRYRTVRLENNRETMWVAGNDECEFTCRVVLLSHETRDEPRIWWYSFRILKASLRRAGGVL
jgi:hypothetical protein